MGKSMRTSISVPSDLKKRMDAAEEQVNWSSVACMAFEQKLAEIASKKASTTMSDVVQRLRASKQRFENDTYREGEEAGREWVTRSLHPAEADDLIRLERFRQENDQHWDRLFEEDDTSAYSIAEMLCFAMDPEEDGNRGYVADFWESAVGDGADKLVSDGAFLKGFAEGALSLWDEVKDQL